MTKYRDFFSLKVFGVILSLLLFSTVVRGSNDRIVIQQIGNITDDIAVGISQQVRVVPFSRRINPRKTPIILKGGMIFIDEDGTVGGRRAHRRAIKRAYRAGQTIVTVSASMEHIEALHRLIGVGVMYETNTDPVWHAYALRQENNLPTARLLTFPRLSPREAENPEDDALAFDRAVDIMVSELIHPPVNAWEVTRSRRRRLGQPINWQDNPLQQTTLTTNSHAGAFNTTLTVYALHSCLDNMDQYIVTALADWTATQAKFQSASEVDGTLYMQRPHLNLVIDWQNTRDNCVSDIVSDNRICRYTQYPLAYGLSMIPPATGTVIQTNAAPPATQGLATSYTSGFTFSIGGTVNVSGAGPGGGINFGASWDNTQSTTVPPLLVEVSNTPNGGQGAEWIFEYCTKGNNSSNCVSEIQMKGSKPLCTNFELGDPQNGQTPEGKFSNVVQTIHWNADSNTRVGDAFDITVDFTALLASTVTNLWYGPFLNFGEFCFQNGQGPQGNCNCTGCGCLNGTSVNPVSASFTFKVPFPSTQCKKNPN